MAAESGVLAGVIAAAGDVSARLVGLYTDLHANPELSRHEVRTSGIVSERLIALGYEVTTGIGGYGVTGVLRRGDGPTVLLRADMDALPVLEQTGLPYASTARGVDPRGDEVPVMHACGHDVHVTALLGAAEVLASPETSWSGTLIALFQPAEEEGGGAQAMVDDGLYERVPIPDIVLGQHVVPLPAGTLGATPGPAFAGTDELDVRLFGRGGHGSQPATTIDPAVMAAATVMRLQTVVAREVPADETAVVTVGTIHVGTKSNIIADEARLGINIRSYVEPVRTQVLDAVHRIVRAESAASGAPREPEIEIADVLPILHNDEDAAASINDAFRAAFGEDAVIVPERLTWSEDVGILASAAGAPLVYWLLGGVDPVVYAEAEARDAVASDIPTNHSPFFAPVIDPTLRMGVTALAVAALAWLAPHDPVSEDPVPEEE